MKIRGSAEMLEKMELEKDAREDVMQLIRAKMIEKTDNLRSVQRLHIDRREAEEKDKLVRFQEDRDLRYRQIERANKLAEELSRRKSKEARELRDLKDKKQISRYSPTLCSLIDLKSRFIEDMIKQDSQSFEILQKWYSDDKFNKIQLANMEEMKRLYCADLQNQIIEKCRIMRELDEERQRERKIIEQTIEVINDEDIRKEEQKKEIQKCLQGERQTFFEARQCWKELQKIAIQEEEQKIAKAIAEKELEYNKQMKKKSDIDTVKERMMETIARKMLDEEIKIKEREDISNELYLEKKKIKEANESLRLALEKRQQTKELFDDMVKRTIANNEKKMEERETEMAFTRNLYEEQLKLDEKDKQKLEEKQRKNKQHGEDLQNIIMNNKIKYAVELLKKQKYVGDGCVGKSY
ncbi:PREDICTED: golgin subfamily A member 6-like protein 1 [Polistes dominula]|uniref:Meiosis-specific nuclear structural protein 1 n=1 Tax=Polistes dominula TaxID=743375 RepID=A0ABM1IAS7_POLDO|nr:PREDICTED: golgin subfamily A member 6-like protein 1 [Polistes dominula]